MKREIKFRAWDDLNKKWLLGYEYPNLGGFSMMGEIMAFGEYQHMLSSFSLEDWDKIKLMQFTGLHDKNGKEIYEGDILFDKEIKAKCIVVFGQFETLTNDWGEKETSPKFCVQWSDKSGYSEIDIDNEIIGNIYQNLDLL